MKEEIKKEYFNELKKSLKGYKSNKNGQNKTELINSIKSSFVLLANQEDVDSEYLRETNYAQSILPYMNRVMIPVVVKKDPKEIFSQLDKSFIEYLPASSIKAKDVKAISVKPHRISPENNIVISIVEPFAGYGVSSTVDGIKFYDNCVYAINGSSLIHVCGKKVGDYKEGVYLSENELKNRYKSKQKFKKEFVGSFANFKSKNKIKTGDFRDWKNLIPNNQVFLNTIHLKELNHAVELIYNNVLFNENKIVQITINGSKYSLDIVNLINAIHSLLKLGVKTIDLFTTKTTKVSEMLTLVPSGDWDGKLVDYLSDKSFVVLTSILASEDLFSRIDISNESFDVFIGGSAKYSFEKTSSPNESFKAGGNISHIKSSDNHFVPIYKKDENHPNFLIVNISYPVGKGFSTALGVETMSGQQRREGAIKSIQIGEEIAYKLKRDFDLDDEVEVTDLENGKVQVFSVSDDFRNLNADYFNNKHSHTNKKTQNFKVGGKLEGSKEIVNVLYDIESYISNETYSGSIENEDIEKGSISYSNRISPDIEQENQIQCDLEYIKKVIINLEMGSLSSFYYDWDGGRTNVTDIPTLVNGYKAVYRSASESEIDSILNNNGRSGTFWADSPIEFRNWGEYLIITNEDTQQDKLHITKTTQPLLIIDKRINKIILNHRSDNRDGVMAKNYCQYKNNGIKNSLTKSVDYMVLEYEAQINYYGGGQLLDKQKFYRGGDLSNYNKWKSIDWSSFKTQSKMRSNIYRLLNWINDERIDWSKLPEDDKERYEYELNNYLGSDDLLEYIFIGQVEDVKAQFKVLLREEGAETDEGIEKLFKTDYDELKAQMDSLNITLGVLKNNSIEIILEEIYRGKNFEWVVDYFLLNDNNWLDFDYALSQNLDDIDSESLNIFYQKVLDEGIVFTEEAEEQQYDLFAEPKESDNSSRYREEMEAYNDLIELAEMDGDKEDIKKFKEIIEGYELLLEMESEVADDVVDDVADEVKTKSVKKDDFKPSYLMTLDEYQKEVTPLIQEYKKFLRKNKDWFVKPNYYGIAEYSLEEAIELKDSENPVFDDSIRYGLDSELSEEQKIRYNYSFKKNRISNKNFNQETPIELIKQNKEFINKLKKYFTLYDLNNRIESDETKSNKRSVRRAIFDDIYKKMLSNKEVEISDLEKVAESVGIKLPKSIFDESTQIRMKYESDLASIMRDIPSISVDKLNELITQIKVDLIPLEKEIYDKEYSRYKEIFSGLIGQKNLGEFLNKLIPIPIFKLFNTTDEIEKGKELINGRERDTKIFYIRVNSFKEGWEKPFSIWLKDYVDSLKYSIILSITKNFDKITIPIASIQKLKVKVGYKGFEGEYKFNFENGSSFVIKFESIGAGGYNIQRYHFRFLTKFDDVILADGSKGGTHYYDIARNFSLKK